MLIRTLFLCCALSSSGQGLGGDEVQFEFWVRHVAAGQAGLNKVSEDWRERFRGMDALGRREPGFITPDEIQRVRACAKDPQPNVRAAALAVHVRHGLPLQLEQGVLESPRMPQVRLQLAGALGVGDSHLALERLGVLVLDEDRDVAQAALAQLFSAGSFGRGEQVEFLQRHWDTLAPSRYLHLLDVIDASIDCGGMVRNIAAWLRDQSEPAQGALDWRVRRALWFSLLEAPVDDLAVDWLGDEWLQAFAGGALNASALEPLRRERLEGVVLAQPYRAQLVERLMLGARSPEESLDAKGDASERYLGGAVAVHFAWQLQGAFEPFPIRNEWAPGIQESAWQACFGRGQRWGDVADGALSSKNERVRDAAWETLSETWNRTGRTPRRGWVAAALRDEFLAERVYRDLLHSRRVLGDLDLYFSWWSEQPTDLQLDLLRSHAPMRRYFQWRGAMIQFWLKGSSENGAVLELLGGLEGDEVLEGLLLAGLLRELEIMEGEAAPAQEVIRGPWREAESRARLTMKAWLSVQGSGHSSEQLEMLLRAGKLGKELSKLLVPALGGSVDGRRALEGALASTKLSGRARYEVLLVHPGPFPGGELDELFLAYSTCDEELQMRILERAAGATGEPARALLKQVGQDSRAGTDLRFQAIRSLAASRRTSQQVSGDLLELLNIVRDWEVQQVLVGALGTRALDLPSTGLLARYKNSFAESLIGDDLLASLVQIDLRKRAGSSVSPRVLELWLMLPEMAKVYMLRERFAGSNRPAQAFVYNGWLRAAKAMGKAGVLEAALGSGWRTWDGRLLMRLSEVLDQDADPGQQALIGSLENAALVALSGEGPSADRVGLMLRLRGRLLNRALDAGEWRAALLRVRGILDDWRSGQVRTSVVERAFGHPDPAQGTDPRGALLAIELECLLRLARQEGDQASVIRLRSLAEHRAMGSSKLGRQRLRVLLDELK